MTTMSARPVISVQVEGAAGAAVVHGLRRRLPLAALLREDVAAPDLVITLQPVEAPGFMVLAPEHCALLARGLSALLPDDLRGRRRALHRRLGWGDDLPSEVSDEDRAATVSPDHADAAALAALLDRAADVALQRWTARAGSRSAWPSAAALQVGCLRTAAAVAAVDQDAELVGTRARAARAEERVRTLEASRSLRWAASIRGWRAACGRLRTRR